MSGQDWENVTVLLALDTPVGRRYASMECEVLTEIMDIVRAGGDVRIVEAKFVQ
jgi:hypothetical protein